MKHIKEYDEFINEAKSPVKIGDVLIHPDGRKGKVVKIMSDMANVDFGKGDVYGIMFRRIKGNQITENYDKRAYDSFTKYLQKNAASANLELFDPIPVGGSIFNKDYEKADNVLSFDWNIIDGKYTGSIKQKIDNFFKKAAAKFNMKPIHIQVGSVEFAPAVNEGKDNTVEKVEEAKYNTVEKVLKKLGRRPSEEELASFITKNYYDVTGVKRGNDDPSRNEKIADLISFYNFDPADFEIAWHYAQNESVNEGKYKLGDKYSSDFDYDGMLRMGANATVGMGLEALQKLYNSFEDVNYHSENKWLGYAIEELEDAAKGSKRAAVGFKKKAKKWLKKFNDACKKELNEGKTSDKGRSLFDKIKPQERWWENDPEDLMAYLYWLKRSLPPVDPRKKKREWLKIMDQLAAKYKAPYKDFSRLAKHKFD